MYKSTIITESVLNRSHSASVGDVSIRLHAVFRQTDWLNAVILEHDSVANYRIQRNPDIFFIFVMSV